MPEIELPDGSIVEFPDGMDTSSMAAVINYHSSPGMILHSFMQPKALEPYKKQVGEVVADMAPVSSQIRSVDRAKQAYERFKGADNPIAKALAAADIGVEGAGLAADVLPIAKAAGIAGLSLLPIMMRGRKGLNAGKFRQAGNIGGAPMSEYVKGVKAGDELIVQHNLTPEKLKYSYDLGGIPVPSIAVSKASNPLEGFGDITLLGDQSMVKPSATNPVWFGDAYTKRRPETFTKFTAKEQKAIDDYYWKYNKDMPNPIKDKNYRVNEVAQGKDKLTGYGMDEINQYQFIRENNIPVDFGDGGYSDVSKALREAIDNNKDSYQAWLGGLKNSIGVQGQERIWQSYDRSKPLNLDNMVKAMKGGAGEENFHYGINSIKGATQDKARNLTDIKSNRDKLQTEDVIKAVKADLETRYESLVNRIDEENGFQNSFSQFSEDLSSTKGNMSQLKQYYKMSPELERDVGDFISEIKNSPVGYFEGKPQRAVDISEYKGALVPEDVPKYVTDILNENGVKYEVYSENGRKEALKKFSDLYFNKILPIPAAGLLGAYMLDKKDETN